VTSDVLAAHCASAVVDCQVKELVGMKYVVQIEEMREMHSNF
jgi:hypothetical protein